jgi:hypothetical protein
MKGAPRAVAVRGNELLLTQYASGDARIFRFNKLTGQFIGAVDMSAQIGAGREIASLASDGGTGLWAGEYNLGGTGATPRIFHINSNWIIDFAFDTHLTIGAPGCAGGVDGGIDGLAFDGVDQLYVSTDIRPDVYIFLTDGTPLGLAFTASYGISGHAWAGGFLFLVEVDAGRIHKVDPGSGNEVGCFETAYGNYCTIGRPFIEDLELDSGGTMWWHGYNGGGGGINNFVEHFNPACGGGGPSPCPAPLSPEPMLLQPAYAVRTDSPTVLRANAPAGIPSPEACSVDACVRLCPGGDFAFQVTVRDANAVPMPNYPVTLDFAGCPTFSICSSQPPGFSVNGRRITSTTDGLGHVSFPILMGGTCPSGQVRVYADIWLLGTRALASPDQDGNLSVDAVDAAILQSKFVNPTYDPTADLSCNGVEDAADMAFYAAHCGHSCTAAVGVGEPPLWTSARLLLSVCPNPLVKEEVANLEVWLPRDGRLVVGLYDIAGRRLDQQLTGTLAAGHQRVPWSVPNLARTGVYSLRVSSETGETAKTQIVILRP